MTPKRTKKPKRTPPPMVQMEALELASFEELVQELKNRTTCLLIVHERPTRDSNTACDLAVDWAGSTYQALGMAEWARKQIYKTQSEQCERS